MGNNNALPYLLLLALNYSTSLIFLRFIEGPNPKRARGLKSVVTEQPQTSDKIVVESVVDQEKVFDSREWPFAPICEDLCRDLFKYAI
jgi:hypothetical protein